MINHHISKGEKKAEDTAESLTIRCQNIHFKNKSKN